MSTEVSRYIATVFAISIVAVLWNYSAKNSELNTALVQNKQGGEIAGDTTETRKFPEVNLLAQAAVVYDFTSEKFLYELNPDAQLPLASLTKLMTVYAALKNAPHNLNVVIDAKSLSSEGDFGLLEKDNWTLSEISEFTLVNSANDGAEAIANSVEKFLGKNFVELMTKTGKNIGLLQTYFINATGLDESKTLPSGYGSARDMAKLALFAYRDHKDIFFSTTYPEYVAISESGVEYRATNTNQDSLNINGLRLSKTGFTDIAGGNLAVVFEIEPQRPIAVVVLGSTKDGRFVDVNTLSSATFEFMSN